MTEMPGRSAWDEWRRHWPLVLAATIGFSFLSLMTASAGVFMEPLGSAFGWNRTVLSAGIALSAVISIFASPAVGALFDRFGTRKPALIGLTITALAITAFSTANGTTGQWIALWLIWGAASMLVQSVIWSTAVAGVFSAGRGLALGVTMSGTALAQVVAPPLANWLVEDFGWRAAYIWLGAGWGGLAFILSYFFLYDAHALRATSQVPAAPASGLTLNAAWRDWSLWRVAASTFLILSVTIAVTVHQFQILVEADVTRAHAGWLVSLSGAAGIVGKLVTGSLIDRFHARWIGGATLASTAIAYPLMMNLSGSVTAIVIGIMISGYAAGTKMQLCAYLTARYGGLRHYGVIFGFMTSMISLAAAIGPLLAGIAHDAYGGYVPLLLAGTAISLVSGALVFSLGAYPVWQDAAGAHEPGT